LSETRNNTKLPGEATLNTWNAWKPFVGWVSVLYPGDGAYSILSDPSWCGGAGYPS